MDIEALSRRVQALEDIAAIERLKAAYCDGCDRDHDPDSVVPLFTPDGVWSAVGFYDLCGRAEIHAHFVKINRENKLQRTMHMIANPSIKVDGDKATGEWRYMMAYSSPSKEGTTKYYRIIGRYRDDFVRIDGQWYIETLRTWAFERNAYLCEPSKVPPEHRVAYESA